MWANLVKVSWCYVSLCIMRRRSQSLPFLIDSSAGVRSIFLTFNCVVLVFSLYSHLRPCSAVLPMMTSKGLHGMLEKDSLLLLISPLFAMDFCKSLYCHASSVATCTGTLSTCMIVWYILVRSSMCANLNCLHECLQCRP